MAKNRMLELRKGTGNLDAFGGLRDESHKKRRRSGERRLGATCGTADQKVLVMFT